MPFEAVYSSLIHSRNKRGKRSGRLGMLNVVTTSAFLTFAFAIILTVIYDRNLTMHIIYFDKK